MGEVEEEEAGCVGVGDDTRRDGAREGVAGEIEGNEARGEGEPRGKWEPERVGREIEGAEGRQRGREAGGDGARERVAGEVEVDKRAR